MDTTRYAGTVVDGYQLREWLEDHDEYDNLARYEAISYEGHPLVEESVWICLECGHEQDSCECYEQDESRYY